MKKFLLHFEHHNDCVVVDITKVDPSITDPKHGNSQTVLAFRFSRKDAEQYLRAVGADADMLERTFATLKRNSVASLDIV